MRRPRTLSVLAGTCLALALGPTAVVGADTCPSAATEAVDALSVYVGEAGTFNGAPPRDLTRLVDVNGDGTTCTRSVGPDGSMTAYTDNNVPAGR